MSLNLPGGSSGELQGGGGLSSTAKEGREGYPRLRTPAGSHKASIFLRVGGGRESRNADTEIV